VPTAALDQLADQLTEIARAVYAVAEKITVSNGRDWPPPP
jgi:hypothetical protein